MKLIALKYNDSRDGTDTTTSTSTVDTTATFVTSTTTIITLSSTTTTYTSTATVTIYSGSLKSTTGQDNYVRLDNVNKDVFATDTGPSSAFVLDTSTGYICGPGRAACLTSNPTSTNPSAKIIFQSPSTTTGGYFPLVCQLNGDNTLSCTVNNRQVFFPRCLVINSTVRYYTSFDSAQCPPTTTKLIDIRILSFTPS